MQILHVANKDDWQRESPTGVYGKNQIESDGFIHCGTVELVKLIHSKFAGIEHKKIMLHINSLKIKGELRWETSPKRGVAFPHIYGLLNTDAVEKTEDYTDFVAREFDKTAIVQVAGYLLS